MKSPHVAKISAGFILKLASRPYTLDANNHSHIYHTTSHNHIKQASHHKSLAISQSNQGISLCRDTRQNVFTHKALYDADSTFSHVAKTRHLAVSFPAPEHHSFTPQMDIASHCGSSHGNPRTISDLYN